MAEYIDKQTALEIIASFRTPYRKEVRVEDVYDAVSKADTVTINDHPDKIKVTNCNYNQFAEVSKKGDLISRQHAVDAFRKELCAEETESGREYAISFSGIERVLNDLPSAQPELPKWARKVERMHNKALKMPYIQKPLAWALYQVWKEYDAERRTDGTEDTD